MAEDLSCRFCHAKHFAREGDRSAHERSHGVDTERRPRALPSDMRHDGTLPVECWCRAEIVNVPQPEVMACRTLSCGRSWCNAPEGVVL